MFKSLSLWFCAFNYVIPRVRGGGVSSSFCLLPLTLWASCFQPIHQTMLTLWAPLLQLVKCRVSLDFLFWFDVIVCTHTSRMGVGALLLPSTLALMSEFRSSGLGPSSPPAWPMSCLANPDFLLLIKLSLRRRFWPNYFDAVISTPTFLYLSCTQELQTGQMDGHNFSSFFHFLFSSSLSVFYKGKHNARVLTRKTG